jgi:hypothetical protein
MSLPEAHSDFSLEMSCFVSTHLVNVSRVASMMGAVSLVTFIAEGAAGGLFVVAGVLVWAKSSGANGKRKITTNKKIKFIVKSST